MRECGEIGKRFGLRSQCLIAYGFNSHHSHQNLILNTSKKQLTYKTNKNRYAKKEAIFNL